VIRSMVGKKVANAVTIRYHDFQASQGISSSQSTVPSTHTNSGNNANASSVKRTHPSVLSPPRLHSHPHGSHSTSSHIRSLSPSIQPPHPKKSKTVPKPAARYSYTA